MKDSNSTIFHNPAIEKESKENREKKSIQSMWRSVITQALIDAASNSKKKIDRLNKARAIEWLKGENDGFFEVCALANMDPDYVKFKTQQAMNRGCKWRNDTRIARPVDIDHRILKKNKNYFQRTYCDKNSVYTNNPRVTH